jgi:hypothetical protein
MMEDKLVLDKHKYLKIRLYQQLRRFYLSEDLLKAEKETTNTSIKQNVIETIINKAGDGVRWYLG